MSKLTKILIACCFVALFAATGVLVASNITLHRSLDELEAKNEALTAQLSATPEPSAAQEPVSDVVAVINGVELLKTDPMAEYEQYEYFYQLYGAADEDTLNQLKNDILAVYAEQEVLNQKAAELGYDQFTDEERASAEETAKTTYEATIAEYLAYFEDESLTDEEVRQLAVDFLDEQNYTLEGLLEYELSNLSNKKLYDMATADVAVTDEELAAAYQERVESDKALYAESPAEFEYAASDGAMLAYVPEGYRRVKNLLILLDDEQQTALADYQSELEAIETERLAEDADEAALDERKAAAEAGVEEVYAAIQDKVDDVTKRLAAGEDFETLLAEYGEDAGMTTEPGKTQGYYVSATSEIWADSFTKAAMALTKPGEVSEPTRSAFGVHFIYYIADAASGEVAYETNEAVFREETLTAKREDAYAQATQGWVEASVIEYFPENMQ